MNTYLRHLIGYFEYVLHPAGAWSADNSVEKRKRKISKPSYQVSPDNYNIRGEKVGKQDKQRRNPAP